MAEAPPNWGVRLHGLEGLEKALLAIGPSQGRQVLVRSMRKALAPVKTDAQSRARRGAKNRGKKRLADSIKISTSLNRNARRKRQVRGVAELFLGPTVPHSHLIEFGHRLVRGKVKKITTKVLERGVGRKSKSGAGGGALQRTKTIGQTGEARVIGRVRAFPFLRPAWDANKERVLEIVKQEVFAELDRVGKRWGLALKGGKASLSTKKQIVRAAKETRGGVFSDSVVTGEFEDSR